MDPSNQRKNLEEWRSNVIQFKIHNSKNSACHQSITKTKGNDDSTCPTIIIVDENESTNEVKEEKNHDNKNKGVVVVPKSGWYGFFLGQNQQPDQEQTNMKNNRKEKSTVQSNKNKTYQLRIRIVVPKSTINHDVEQDPFCTYSDDDDDDDIEHNSFYYCSIPFFTIVDTHQKEDEHQIFRKTTKITCTTKFENDKRQMYHNENCSLQSRKEQIDDKMTTVTGAAVQNDANHNTIVADHNDPCTADEKNSTSRKQHQKIAQEQSTLNLLLDPMIGKLMYLPNGCQLCVVVVPKSTVTDRMEAERKSKSVEKQQHLQNSDYSRHYCWYLVYNHHHRRHHATATTDTTCPYHQNQAHQNKQDQNDDVVVVPQVSHCKKSFVCSLCVRLFPSARAVQGHIQSKHQNNIRLNHFYNHSLSFKHHHHHQQQQQQQQQIALVDINKDDAIDHQGCECRSLDGTKKSCVEKTTASASRTNCRINTDGVTTSSVLSSDNISNNNNNTNTSSCGSISSSIWTTPLKVIHEDPYMIIIDKPQGMPVMGAKPSLIRSDLLLQLGRQQQQMASSQKQRLKVGTIVDNDNIIMQNDAIICNSNSNDHASSENGIESERDEDHCAHSNNFYTNPFNCLNKPRPVHRLDSATGGLLVLARTKWSESWLRLCFQQRTVKKRYQAIVYGKVCVKNYDYSTDNNDHHHDRSGTTITTDSMESNIDFPSHSQTAQCNSLSLVECCRRPATDNDMNDSIIEYGTIVFPVRGKPSITKYTVVRTIRSIHSVDTYMSIVNLWPITGRRHQLRRHLKQIGHPIVGDTRYNNNYPNIKKNNACRDTNRNNHITNTFCQKTIHTGTGTSSVCGDKLKDIHVRVEDQEDIRKRKYLTMSHDKGDDVDDHDDDCKTCGSVVVGQVRKEECSHSTSMQLQEPFFNEKTMEQQQHQHPQQQPHVPNDTTTANIIPIYASSQQQQNQHYDHLCLWAVEITIPNLNSCHNRDKTEKNNDETNGDDDSTTTSTYRLESNPVYMDLIVQKEQDDWEKANRS